MRASLVLVVLLFASQLARGRVECDCQSSDPEMAEAKQCSLCREADKRPAGIDYFILKDINPTKPNRWLILPRMHLPGLHAWDAAPAKLRTEIWQAAMVKGQSLWPDEWGLAYNGASVRTQCHTHIHIGKLLPGVETKNFVVVNGAAEIPMVPGDGLWVHPITGGKLHVHHGEQKPELVLMR